MNTIVQKIKTPLSRLSGAEINLLNGKIQDGVPNSNLSEKRVLIVSHSYIPLLSPRSFRWSAIANHWVSSGVSVDVVTSWIPGSLRREKISGVNVIRVGGAVSEKLRWALRSSDRSTAVGYTKPRVTMKSRVVDILKPLLQLVHNALWKSIYWPDYACLWIAPAIRESKRLLERNNYDALITVSDPFSSHLVGRKLSQANPRLHWLVDIGDPFCFRTDTPANNNTLYSGFSSRVERKIFTAANEITVTTATTQQKYASIFPESEAKIRVIPPLMAPVADERSERQSRARTNGGALTLVFVGTLYKAIRNPQKLLELFADLVANRDSQKLAKKLELHFYGGIDGNQEFFEPYADLMNENIFVHGLVRRQVALSAMHSADILVNIGNDNPYQLPSKIIEYACAGKPILNLYTHSEDCSREFLKNYPLALNLKMNSNDSGAEQLAKVIEFIDALPQEIDKKSLGKLRSKFSVSAISNSYLEQISAPVLNHGGGK